MERRSFRVKRWWDQSVWFSSMSCRMRRCRPAVVHQMIVVAVGIIQSPSDGETERVCGVSFVPTCCSCIFDKRALRCLLGLAIALEDATNFVHCAIVFWYPLESREQNVLFCFSWFAVVFPLVLFFPAIRSAFCCVHGSSTHVKRSSFVAFALSKWLLVVHFAGCFCWILPGTWLTRPRSPFVSPDLFSTDSLLERLTTPIDVGFAVDDSWSIFFFGLVLPDTMWLFQVLLQGVL